MADIVRLEENGVPKYIETHIKAVKGVERVIKKIGMNDIISNKDKINELEGMFVREGNHVSFHARVNVKTVLTGPTSPNSDALTMCLVPNGFRLSNEFDDFAWNVALSIAVFYNPSKWNSSAFVERLESNKIVFFSDVTGNHYISGSWFTDDPYPS